MPTATATRTVTITDMIALDDRLGPIHFFEMETKDDEGFAVFHSNVVISTTNPVALGSDLRRLASELPAASTLSAAVDETVSGGQRRPRLVRLPGDLLHRRAGERPCLTRSSSPGRSSGG